MLRNAATHYTSHVHAYTGYNQNISTIQIYLDFDLTPNTR